MFKLGPATTFSYNIRTMEIKTERIKKQNIHATLSRKMLASILYLKQHTYPMESFARTPDVGPKSPEVPRSALVLCNPSARQLPIEGVATFPFAILHQLPLNIGHR